MQLTHSIIVLCLIPLVVALNHFLLGVGVESLVIMALTWMYNDLRGGDEGYVVRNAIIAAAFGVYNTGSVKVALGTAAVRDSGLFGGLSTECVIWAGSKKASNPLFAYSHLLINILKSAEHSGQRHNLHDYACAGPAGRRGRPRERPPLGAHCHG